MAPFVSKATQTIPIVFVMSADPLQLGLVASVARPGGNTTGFTFLQDELASKRLQLLKEVAPRISRVAFLSTPDHPDNELRVAQRAATALGVHLQPIEMRGPGDLDAALQPLRRRPLTRSACPQDILPINGKAGKPVEAHFTIADEHLKDGARA